MDEKELERLQSQAREADATEQRARTEAKELLARRIAEGADLRSADVLTEIDRAFAAADAAKETSINTRKVLSHLVGGEAAAERAEKELASASFGDAFVRSASVARFRSDAGRQLLNSRGSSIDSGLVEVASRERAAGVLSPMRARVFDNATNVGRGLLLPDYTGKLIEQYSRRVRLLDVLTMSTTDTDIVDWMVENARTQSAAETAFGTALPESAYGFSRETTTVKRAGHHITATTGVLADAGRSRTLIDARLLLGLRQRIESQLLSGNGVDENLKGLTTYSGILTRAVGTDTPLDAIHKAITDIRVASEDMLDPGVVLINPTTYEGVVLEKTADGVYIFGQPTSDMNPSLWGLTPVVSTLIPTGTAIVLDPSVMTVFMREGITIQATNMHSDYFLKGYVAIKAECRLAAAVQEVKGINVVTGL